MSGRLRRASLLAGIIPAVALCVWPTFAAERELEEHPPPSSTSEIQTSIQRMFPEEPERRLPLFPWFHQPLQQLPPFFADTMLEARFRTYYLRKDRTSDVLSQAWATGGSIYYRSGWLEDLFQVEVEGFTSQPVVAPDDQGGAALLAPVQDGYSVLGIANGTLRYRGVELTGYRQYLDLPYLNRNDSRMTPNTFEAITLAKPEGALKLLGGYTWSFKDRISDEFISPGKAAGLDGDRGMAYGGAIWDPNEDFHIGLYAGTMLEVAARIYAELGAGRSLAYGWHARLDGQFTYLWDIGDDLLGASLDNSWNFAIRAAASRAGAVFRLGASVAGPDSQDRNDFGSSPSYVDLMQRTFNAPAEKALLASISYDFQGLGLDGLSAVVTFAAGFDAKFDGGRSNAQEVDVTIDYRMKKEGWWNGFWLRLRGSWLDQGLTKRDGTDLRVILRYDFPVI